MSSAPPVILVVGGVEEPAPDGLLVRFATSLARSRLRTLMVQVLPHSPLLPPPPLPPTPHPLTADLWRVACTTPPAPEVLRTAWHPTFAVVLVGGVGDAWPLAWAGVATHVLLVVSPSPDGATSAFERLAPLPASLPVGCMVDHATPAARAAYDRLATAVEQAGRRPVQWLGGTPGERGDWRRTLDRLVRRLDRPEEPA